MPATLTHEQHLPRLVVPGIPATLALPLLDEAGAEVTLEAGTTVEVLNGTTALVPAAAPTTLGPPASYTLAGPVTEGLAPSGQYLEVWRPVLGGAQLPPITVPGYLVLSVFTPTLTDALLLERHSRLGAIRDPTLASFEPYREAARRRIERDLLKRGRRPWLIVDNWALEDAHLAFTLHLFYSDASQNLGGQAPEYARLAHTYLGEYRAELESMQFRYRKDDQVVVPTEDQDGAVPAVVLTAGRRRPWGLR